MSLPVGLSADGLPIGLQLLGKPFDEETVFTAARALEKAANFSAVPQILTAKAA
jgi:aspartyl-tRNA(Asn)/glutamyl-tRNA(Gln) amidotransferase subunit A